MLNKVKAGVGGIGIGAGLCMSGFRDTAGGLDAGRGRRGWTNGRMDGGMIECKNVGIGEGREAGREGCADERMNGGRRGRTNENARPDERTNARMRGRTNEFTNARTDECAGARVRGRTRTNENTGLHPVLTYCAPSGLGGLMHNADNLATNARMPG